MHYVCRMSRRYKTHLRDFLSTCRSKRSYSNISDPTYNNYNNVYSASTYATDNTSLYMNPQNLGNLQSLYPSSYIPTDNLFPYRQLGSYYPDYMTHSYVSNGYMDPATRPCIGYDATGLAKPATTDPKFYCSSQLDASKYASQYYSTANTVLPPLEHKYDIRAPSAERREHTPLLAPPSPAPPSTMSLTPLTPTTDVSTPNKDLSYTNGTRQTVLMWGSADSAAPTTAIPEYEPIKKYSESPSSSNITNGGSPAVNYTSAVAGVQEAIPGAACKWGPPSVGTPGARSSSGGSPHEGASPPGSGGGVGGKVGGTYYTTPETGEVWPPHQYYHYHHPYHTPQ